MITERIYKTHDNKAQVEVTFSDSATPLQGVTRITCALKPSGVLIDSDTGGITWTAAGVITFDYGQQTVNGLQQATLVAYDPAHVNGQRIADPNGTEGMRLSFQFVT